MFEKRKVEEPDAQEEEELERTTSENRHPVAVKFEIETMGALYPEWEIFETRYRAVLNLKEGASKVDVQRALSRVKRASMDVRDALKALGRFKT